MQIELNKNELREGIALASLAVDRRAQLPVLRNIKLSAQDGHARLTSMTLYHALTLDLKCDTIEPGDTLLADRSALRFLASKEDSTVFVSRDDKFTRLTIDKVGQASFANTRIEDFPAVPSFEEPLAQATLDAQWFIRALSWVIPCAATEESRPVLTGVVMNHTGMAAADGFRLSKVDSPVFSFIPEGKEFIVPAKTLTMASKLFRSCKELNISLNEKMIYITGDDKTLLAQLIDGHFPNYRNLVPKKGTQVEFSAPLMYQRLSMIDPIATSSGIVRFYFNKEARSCRIYSGEEGYALFNMELNCRTRKDCKIAINIAYIMEAIKPFAMVKARIDLPSQPILIRGDLEELTVVIMPMFVQWDKV